jgi:prophage maintenance system killer protein
LTSETTERLLFAFDEELVTTIVVIGLGVPPPFMPKNPIIHGNKRIYIMGVILYLQRTTYSLDAQVNSKKKLD